MAIELPDKRIIHLHIPKTAGTSVRRVLVGEFGPSRVMVYDHTSNEFIRSSHRITGSERPLLDQLKRSVREHHLLRYIRPFYLAAKMVEHSLNSSDSALESRSYDALSGHFTAADISKWGLGNDNVVSVVREPMQRAWSHYLQWQHTQGMGANSALAARFVDGISFEEFALDPSMHNFQQSHLGSTLPLTLGIQEKLPEFIEAIGLKVPDHIPRLNVHVGTDMPEPSQSFLHEFTESNTADYELYAAVRGLYFAQVD